MKTSILVIAHNEEKNIERCLLSVKKQTIKPDEILIICHNCKDKTAELSRKIEGVRVIEDTSEPGSVFARIRGFKEACGDIICCLDGDSWVKENWLEKITEPFLKKEVVAVGTDVRIHGTLLDYLGSISYFYFGSNLKRYSKNTVTFFWGASFAIRKESYDKIGGLEKMIELRQKLNLVLTPDDWYLGIMLSKIGKISITRKTTAHVNSKCKNSYERYLQTKKQVGDGKKLYDYFNLKK